MGPLNCKILISEVYFISLCCNNVSALKMLQCCCRSLVCVIYLVKLIRSLLCHGMKGYDLQYFISFPFCFIIQNCRLVEYTSGKYSTVESDFFATGHCWTVELSFHICCIDSTRVKNIYLVRMCWILMDYMLT